MRLIFRSTITVRVCVRTGETPESALRRVVAASEDLAASLALKQGTFVLHGSPDFNPDEEASKVANPILRVFRNLRLGHGSFDRRNASFIIAETGDGRTYPIFLVVTPSLYSLAEITSVEEGRSEDPEGDEEEAKADSRQLLLWEDDGD